MLKRVAQGVLVHESEFLQSNAGVVEGSSGVLLIDAGITNADMRCLADDLRELGHPVAAGFSTHPHWDHVLWHSSLGNVARYGTERCAAALRDQMAAPDWKDREAEELPPEIADDVSFDLFGLVTGLPPDAAEIPWDGPQVRILEHQAHAPGHAALVIEEAGVLVAGDMLSDILIPFLDMAAVDPIADYLDALRRFEGVAGEVDVVVPGHGSVGDGAQLRGRIDLDRSYVQALREGVAFTDPRLDPSAPHGSWLPGVDEWQREQAARG